MAYLLGEMRRQMNGAVVGGMRFYGEEYGLNYGVSIATVRSIAREQLAQHGVDHRFARQLYLQEVRELRLAALWLADCEVVGTELDFWAAGIVNSEIAEEAAFALFSKVEGVEAWLDSADELLRYAAVLSMAKRGDGAKFLCRVAELIEGEVHLLPKALVAMMDAALRDGVEPVVISDLLSSLPESCGAARYLREEMAWRMGCE